MNKPKFECVDHGDGRIFIGWKTATARFHFWLNATKDGAQQNTIYKNPLGGHLQPGYFNTRHLQATAKTNALTVKLALQSVDITKAIAARIEKEAQAKRDGLAQVKERRRLGKLEAIAPDMYQSLIDMLALHDGQHPWTMTEQSDKIKAARALVAKGVA